MRLRSLVVSLIVIAGVLAPVTAYAAPAAPTNVQVTDLSPANTATDQAAINVSWTRVTNETIAQYVVWATATGATTPVQCTAPQSDSPSCSISGLAGGTNYSIVVFAFNTDGIEGTKSTAVNHIAKSIPGAPTAVSAVAGVGQVTLTWSAPANSGGHPLGDYKISATGVTEFDVANTLTTQVVTGLTAGSEYTFQIKSSNTLGNSLATSFSAVTVPTTPGAPTSASASVSGTTITASWVAPTSNGGSAITGYKAYLINEGGNDVVSTTPTTTNTEFTSVAPGTYTVRVIASNLVGDSARSVASSSATVAAASSKLGNDPVIQPVTISDLLIDATVEITTSTPSGLTVTVSVSANPAGACTYDAVTKLVTGVLAGTCTVNATAAETTTYAAGLSTKTFNIVKLAQTITFPALSNQVMPGPLVVAATASSGLTVSFTASGTCSVTGTTVSFSGAGT